MTASALGFATAWIERSGGRAGFGVTPAPERMVRPTYHPSSMCDLASQVREDLA